MAQRAYRRRKESTISSLEEKVQDLSGTNEEMSNIFINLCDFAVNSGLLEREPDFGQQLQSTMERFLALAKASAGDTHKENQEDDAKHELAPGRRPKRQKASPKRRQEDISPVSEAVLSFGGYILAKEETLETDIEYGGGVCSSIPSAFGTSFYSTSYLL
jgi:hypothetical protein